MLYLVDHYTKYLWLHPLKLKFKVIVKNYLKTNIVTIYLDSDGEY